jgi:hypothetical protein
MIGHAVMMPSAAAVPVARADRPIRTVAPQPDLDREAAPIGAVEGTWEVLLSPPSGRDCRVRWIGKAQMLGLCRHGSAPLAPKLRTRRDTDARSSDA